MWIMLAATRPKGLDSHSNPMDKRTPTVLIVDDDPSVLRSMVRLVRQSGYQAREFSSGVEFLDFLDGSPRPVPACLLLDLSMPGINGLEVQRRLLRNPASCPVVFVSGNGNIPAIVEAMQQGAVTFLTKPLGHNDLLQAIAQAVQQDSERQRELERLASIQARIESLTHREQEVMKWVISGALNKQIASHLEIVEKTVKVHRARVMEKMQVVSVAELVRLCEAVGYDAARE